MLEHGQQQQQQHAVARLDDAPTLLNNSVPGSRQLQARRRAVAAAEAGVEAGSGRAGSAASADASK